jgi:hypothetical protein
MVYKSSMRAKGIRALTQPSIYILSVVLAFFLYHADRLYDLRRLIGKTRDDVNNMTDQLRTSNDANASIDALWVFILAVLILSGVLAVKKVLAKRAKNDDNDDDVSYIEDYIHDNYGSNGYRAVHACEQITQEEYNYQSNATTRKEINKLVNSAEYKRTLQKKGKQVSAWNWQAHDREEGFIPDADQNIKEDFELADEIDQVDDQLRNQELKITGRRLRASDQYARSATTAVKT